VRLWISKLEALAVAQIFRKDAATSVEGVVEDAWRWDCNEGDLLIFLDGQH
jgi:hypothetical protein